MPKSRVAEGGRGCWEAKDPTLPSLSGCVAVGTETETCRGCKELKWKSQEIKCKKCIVSKRLKEVAEPLTNWLFVWLADAEVEQEINSICHRLTFHYYFLGIFPFFFFHVCVYIYISAKKQSISGQASN